MDVMLQDAEFDRIAAPIASLGFFAEKKALRQTAGLVDWRLNGAVSRLIAHGRLFGTAGECLMMPTGHRLKADALMLYGIGPRQEWNAGKAETEFMMWVKRLDRLRRDTWLLSFSGLAGDFLEWRNCARIFINHVIHHSDQVCQRLIFAEPTEWIHEARRREMDFGPSVRVLYEEK